MVKTEYVILCKKIGGLLSGWENLLMLNGKVQVFTAKDVVEQKVDELNDAKRFNGSRIQHTVVELYPFDKDKVDK